MRAALAIALAAAALTAHSEDPAAALGKQRAAGSRVDWEIRDAGHPSLGNIRYAYIKRPVETPVGDSTVFSRAYFSCQKNRAMFAIELANATAPADPEGLKPAAEPRLVCNRPTGPGGAEIAREELLANWEINAKLGDALTRGLRAFPLRECASIGVVQEVVLPPGWARKTARIEFEILPYARELDAIFVACGERSAYVPGPVAPAATVASAPAAPGAAPPAAPAPAVAKPPPARAPVRQAQWVTVRVVAGGRTNVRAGPRLQSAIVIRLDPGSLVQVQRTGADWWRARAARGPRFDGYIRQDRLVFR
jgi:hypothetical protein